MTLISDASVENLTTNTKETSLSSFACHERLQWEFRPSYPLFSLQEPCGRMLDVGACFAPRRKCHGTLFYRLFAFAWALQVLYDDVFHTYPKHNLWIYLGYLTHWGHVILILYLFCSLLCCILPNVLKQPSNDSSPHSFIKWTWGLFSLAAPLELAITVLYWGSGIASPHTTYASIMEHGVLGLLVWIDGIIIGSIPVRAKQVVFLISTATLYLTWTIINALLEIGNGEWGPAYNDDALYPVLNWNKQTRAAAILSAIVELVVAPGLFYLCWLTSLLSPKQDTTSPLEEEGNRCCCHGGCSCCCCYRRLVCDGSRRPLYSGGDSTGTSGKKGEGFDYNEMDNSNDKNDNNNNNNEGVMA